MVNEPKHTSKAAQTFLKAKKQDILQWPNQSSDLNPGEHAFYLVKAVTAEQALDLP